MEAKIRMIDGEVYVVEEILIKVDTIDDAKEAFEKVSMIRDLIKEDKKND